MTNGHWTLGRDIATLPYPIASPLLRIRRAHSRRLAEKTLNLTFDLVEELLKFTNALLLAEHLHIAGSIDHEFAALANKRQSLGDRVALTRGLSRSSRSPLGILIRDGWKRSGRSFGQNLGSIVQLRNSVAHGSTPTENVADGILRDLLDRTNPLGPLIDELAAGRLFSTFTVSTDDSKRGTALEWSGPTTAYAETDIELPPAVIGGDCFILRGDAKISLQPFVLARHEPLQEEPDLWLFDHGGGSFKWTTMRPRGAESPPNLDRSSPSMRKLDRLLSLSRPDSVREQRASHYFKSTPFLMNRLLNSFVERPEISEQVRRLFVQQESGSLWLTAPAGSGKSSVVSALIRNYRAIHHFVSDSEGRDSYSAILRSLIEQLVERIGADIKPSENDEALPVQLANLLVEAAMNNEDAATVVAIDAMDELGSGQAIDRLVRAFPEELPSGVYLIMSSRPLPPSIRVSRHFDQYELRPLTVDVIVELARKHGLPTSLPLCEKAFIASGGNPLYAIWALTLLRDRPSDEIDFSRNLDDFLDLSLAKFSTPEQKSRPSRFLRRSLPRPHRSTSPR